MELKDTSISNSELVYPLKSIISDIKYIQSGSNFDLKKNLRKTGL